MDLTSIFSLLEAGLSLWQDKNKTRYQDKKMKLQKEYYEEFNKVPHDNAKLDNIEFELGVLCDSFCSQIGK